MRATLPFRGSGRDRAIDPRRTGTPHRDRGSALVEFAIILPILLVLMLGILNFGFLFGQQLSLNNAVREGARAAVVAGDKDSNGTEAGIKANVRAASGLISDSENIGFPGLSIEDGKYACSDSLDPATGTVDDLTVTATYQASLLAPMPIPGLSDAKIGLSSEAVYRCEYS